MKCNFRILIYWMILGRIGWYFLSFIAALVSMLSLEIAMTARFGSEDYMFRKWIAAMTGAGVFVIVFIIAILMILRANRLIRQ